MNIADIESVIQRIWTVLSVDVPFDSGFFVDVNEQISVKCAMW